MNYLLTFALIVAILCHGCEDPYNPATTKPKTAEECKIWLEWNENEQWKDSTMAHYVTVLHGHKYYNHIPKAFLDGTEKYNFVKSKPKCLQGETR